jgi:hypothetical protein
MGLAVCVHETHCQPHQLGKKGLLLSRWQRYTNGGVTRLADLVLPTIRPWQERVIREYAVPPHKVALLPIGSNIPPVRVSAAEREELRRKLGWRNSETVGVIFGSYPSQVQALERFETLLMQGVQEGYLDRIVCLGGEGPAHAQDLEPSHWAERLGCAPNQFEVLGPRPAQAVGEVLACCDLALAPTSRRLLGKSGAFMAFAAAGLPVIGYEDAPPLSATDSDDWPVFSSQQWQWGLVRSEAVRESGKALQMRYQKSHDWPVIARRALTLLNETMVQSAE